ncbi:hypothetical protein Ddc_04512 [Ditylenchus destructor]|nr:hypothetical protein Ddc_04512 [Ditylenchus destructor]
MDQPPQPSIPFGLFYNILTCFDRRELCQLRNVNRRHYSVIDGKFGTTPYLLFFEQHLKKESWKWSPENHYYVNNYVNKFEDMPFHVRKQLSTSKFVRFKTSRFVISSVSDLIVLPISHVWENQELSIECVPNYIWNEEWTHMATKAKHLKLEAKGLIPYLRQLTSGNCVNLGLISLDDALVDVQLPWDHILDFLFQRNTLGIDINARNQFNNHPDQQFEFLQQIKQKFLDSLVPVDFWFEFDYDSSFDSSSFGDFIVKNPRTKQRLILRIYGDAFTLTVRNSDQ